MLRRRLFGVVLAVSLSAAPVWAQAPDEATRTAARALGTAGVEAYQAGDYAGASDKLEKAYQILKVPSLGLWSARALEKRGQLVEALNRYLEASSIQVPAGEASVQQKAQADAEREGEALKPRVPRLVITVQGADAADVSLTIDGKAVSSSAIGVPRLVNAGRHVVEVVSGSQRARGEVACAESKQASLTLELGSGAARATLASTPAPAAGSGAATPAPASAPGSDRAWQPTFGWVALGAGVVGIAVGSATGLMAMNERSKLDDSQLCQGDRCPSSLKDTVDSLSTFRTISTIGFVAGGVLAATGVTLLLTAPKAGAEAALYVGPGSAGLTGSF